MTLLMGFAAVNTGNNLVYLIVSAFLSFMGISGLFGKNNIERIDVGVELPSEVFAQTEFPMKVKLRNRRRFLPAFLVSVRVGDREALFPFVGAGREEAEILNAVFKRRGRHALRDIHVCSVFPFNFFVRCRRVPRSPEVIVFPKAKTCALWSSFEKEARKKGETSSGKTGHEGEIVSFRNYAQGDPVKYIYWKASAKTGDLKTKELSSTVRQPVVIDFDGIQMGDIEEKLSCVTYTVLKLFRQNTPVGLRIGGNLFRAGLLASHRTRLLRELALYGPRGN